MFEYFTDLIVLPYRVRSKEVKKRTLQRIPLCLGPGLEIGVGVCVYFFKYLYWVLHVCVFMCLQELMCMHMQKGSMILFMYVSKYSV